MQHRLENSSTRVEIWLWVVVCLLLTIFGCGTSGDEHQATPASSKQSSFLTLRAVFTSQAQVAGSQAAVQCLVLRVTGPGLGAPVFAQQVLTASQDSVVFVAQIPIGTDRTFTVEAFREIAACQTGTATPNFIPIFMGQSAPVTIASEGTTVTVELALVETPVVRPLVPQEADAGTEVNLPIVAGNPTGAPVTCSAIGLPPGLSINPTTCLITGVPSNTAEGVYNVTIIATSGTDRASTAFTLTIVKLPPVANAGPNQRVLLGQTVQLDGSRSSDVNGNPLIFRWTLTTRPAGSQATLANAALVNPTFIVDQPGTYVVQLIVNNGLADSAPATVIITTTNSPPTADAGLDQTVFVGRTVQLDGSRSSDVDGDPLTFRWALTTRPAGSQATLANATTVNPSFVVDVLGTYRAQLIVNDGTFDSRPATVTLAGTSRPVANAGLDQAVFVGQTVQLDGSRSSDADGDPLTFRWALTTRPAGSQATLANATTVNPSFVVDVLGTYVAQLIVNDGTFDSLPATVTLAGETRPVANAGLDQAVFVGQTVQLDGSRSSDADGDPLTFRWALTTRPAGSQATLANATTVNPSFVVDVLGTYVAQLIVNDGTFDSLPDTVTLAGTSRPVANAGPDQAVFVGQTVQLDGSRSSDVDGDPLTFRWALTTRPAGSQATLANATAVNPTFAVDRPGAYVAQLIVNDGTFDSLPDTVTLGGTPRPVANAGPDQAVFVGQTVQLDGSRSSDANGAPLTFRWALTTRPAGSQATLANATAVNPTFVVDRPGAYVAQLIVNNGTFDSLPDTVTLAGTSRPVASICARSLTVLVGTTVQLLGSCSSDADGDPLTFRWALTTRPTGSQATLANATTVSPTFVADQRGTYVVQLIVNDGTFDSPPTTITITAGVPPTISTLAAELRDPVADAQGCPQDPGASLFRYTFNYSDPDGDVSRAVGATVNLQFRFSNGTSGAFDATPFSTFGGNGFTGSISVLICSRFSNAISVNNTFTLTDGGGNVGNSLTIPINDPNRPG